MGFLTSLLRAASPENPRFGLSDPSAWDAFGATPSSSGVSVNRESALTYSPWWRGINLLSRDVGKLPLFVYRRKGEGKERATDHPAYRLLRRKPNAYQTALVFRQTLQAHALSSGNGYAYIFRRGDGSPEEILPLDPDQTTPVREGGRLWYVTSVEGDKRKLPGEDVLHVKGLSYDGLTGYSVFDKARESLGLGLGARKFASVFFKNNARPNLAIEYPGKLTDAAATVLRESWERMHAGLNEAHRVALLMGGAKLHEFSINAGDAQLLETRQFELREVANWIGVPPHKLGDTTRSSYASVEAENLSYLTESLDFWLCCWEEECSDKLLTEAEKEEDTHAVEFLRQALVRADLTTRANYYRTALGGRGWVSPNEVRALENMNPSEEPDADLILTPLNMGQGGPANEPRPFPGAAEEEEPKEPPPDPPDPEAQARREKLAAAHRGLLADACRRMVRRIGVHAERAAGEPGRYLAWVDTFPADHQRVVAEALAPAIGAAAVLLGRPLDAEAEAAALLEDLRARYDALADTTSAADLFLSVEALGRIHQNTLPDAWAGRLLAYSEDQPRDEQGRFGEGGGGDEGSGDDEGGGDDSGGDDDDGSAEREAAREKEDSDRESHREREDAARQEAQEKEDEGRAAKWQQRQEERETKQAAEEKRIEQERERQDGDRQARREKEDAARQQQRDHEDEQTQKQRDKEDGVGALVGAGR